jgi:aquaporin Z
MRIVTAHWRVYLVEAACLALFMVSAAGSAVALQHPQSPLARWFVSELARRVPMGIAMGLTAAALIYSPLGRRSGAHMNPAVTLAFFRLGKIETVDAGAYVAAQFAGGIAGIGAATLLLRGLPGHPSVNYVATAPGAAGIAAAFAGEIVISGLMMLVVLTVSSSPRYARFTGAAAASLVALFITVEAPLSGMSMNPARTFGSGLFAHSPHLWIYFTAPPLGMLAAAELIVRLGRRERVRCAKLHHHQHGPCHFRCGHTERQHD